MKSKIKFADISHIKIEYTPSVVRIFSKQNLNCYLSNKRIQLILSVLNDSHHRLQTVTSNSNMFADRITLIFKCKSNFVEPNMNSQALEKNPDSKVCYKLDLENLEIVIYDDFTSFNVPIVKLNLEKGFLRVETSNDNRCFEGTLKTMSSIDLYNPELSWYEPSIELWEFDTKITHSPISDSSNNNIKIVVRSLDLLKFNLTKTTLSSLRLVERNFRSHETNCTLESQTVSVEQLKPFIIKNDTGFDISYSKVLVSIKNVVSPTYQQFKQSQWFDVPNGKEYAFNFDDCESYSLPTVKKVHQIKIRIEGYDEIGPITVDKVGINFRHAQIMDDALYKISKSRVVVSVKMLGESQKLITVRSALQIINQTEYPFVLAVTDNIDYSMLNSVAIKDISIVLPSDTFNVPLTYVYSKFYIKALDKSYIENYKTVSSNIESFESYVQHLNQNKYSYSESNFTWINCSNQISKSCLKCKSTDDHDLTVLVTIRRENFPKQDLPIHPGHTITLKPPLQLHNCLPYDLFYKLPSGNHEKLYHTSSVNIMEVEQIAINYMYLALDSFPGCAALKIQSGNRESVVRLIDNLSREILLNLSIENNAGEGINVYFSASFWIINLTSMPLIYRQEGSLIDAAGQYNDNETAANVKPFILSFTDHEKPQAFQIRLGYKYGDKNPVSSSLYSVMSQLTHHHPPCFIYLIKYFT